MLGRTIKKGTGTFCFAKRASPLREIMDEEAGVGVDFLEELENFLGSVAREPVGDFAEGVVRSKNVGGAGESGEFVEDR